MSQGLLLKRTGEVAWLIIDRQEKRNAITDAMWTAIPALIAEVGADPAVKILVLTGAGDAAFSAGADINEYRTRVGDPDWGRLSQQTVANASEAVRTMAKPTIAAIRGTCVGGGVVLALSCDLRVADQAATFAIPPARLGLVFPFGDTKALVELVGPSRAKSLLFTTRTLRADEALQIGFVDEVVPGEKLESRVQELAGEIASQSQYSVRASKRIIDLINDGLTEENDEVLELIAESLKLEDHAEGVAAFLDRRPPSFTFR